MGDGGGGKEWNEREGTGLTEFKWGGQGGDVRCPDYFARRSLAPWLALWWAQPRQDRSPRLPRDLVLSLLFLFLPPSSFLVFQMSRLAALLLLVPAVLGADYIVGVGKDETT